MGVNDDTDSDNEAKGANAETRILAFMMVVGERRVLPNWVKKIGTTTCLRLE